MTFVDTADGPRGFDWDGRVLRILDQSALPAVERWVRVDGPAVLMEAIGALRVRGAPLLGVLAARLLAMESGRAEADWQALAAAVRAARPTAVNLMHAVDRMRAARAAGRELGAEADAVAAEDAAACARIAQEGAAALADGAAVLTVCHTGALATAGIGTALGAVRHAAASGKRVFVWVCETRPLLQGARLTGWELTRLGVPWALLADGAAASLLLGGRVTRVMVGADRIARNGDFANKTGTLAVAAAARLGGVPLDVLAPWTTVDPACPGGGAIPIEQRAAAEVQGFAGPQGAVRWAAAGGGAYNPAFDVTPGAWVARLVTDRGAWPGEALAGGAWVDQGGSTGTP